MDSLTRPICDVCTSQPILLMEVCVCVCVGVLDLREGLLGMIVCNDYCNHRKYS